MPPSDKRLISGAAKVVVEKEVSLEVAQSPTSALWDYHPHYISLCLWVVNPLVPFITIPEGHVWYLENHS